MPTTEKQNTENTGAAAPAISSVDTLFSSEHQSMIAAKYRQKYSDADSERHTAQWPQYKGNHFMLYVLAETLREAQKAVFSANKKVFLAMIQAAMVKWTVTAPGATLTDLQGEMNKLADADINVIYEKIPAEEERTELLKDYAKSLKMSAKTGKQTEEYKARFYHVAGILGIPGNMIW